MAKRREHPSGKPIRDEAERALGFPRIPREEFLTPGLRARELASAIGFPLDPVSEDEDDEWTAWRRRR
jgi:hypothetical protein